MTEGHQTGFPTNLQHRVTSRTCNDCGEPPEVKPATFHRPDNQPRGEIVPIEPDPTTQPTNHETSYDIVPYPSGPFPQTHPDRLATIGRLFGLDPPPTERCRVLELGCASGGNLIPMAYHLPDSRFLGIDLSRRQVDSAREIISGLGLSNIRIEHASILDVDDSYGTFDYILCHGVYSWVDANVQAQILAIASNRLAPNGIAYVSYNTYPGWHLRGMIRHMMRFHAGQFHEPVEQIQQARALMAFLARAAESSDTPYGLLLKSELDLIHRSRDWYLFHDHLEEINRPVYFHQFIEAAAGHGLQYLGEAEFSTMLDYGFTDEVRETLERISGDMVSKEQYMDFIRQRYFRQTLLCRSDRVLQRNLDPSSIEGLLVASSAQPDSPSVDLSPDRVESFRTADGRRIDTASPITKAALLILGEHRPRALPVDDLFRRAQARVMRSSQAGPAPDLPDPDVLATDLIWCYGADVVEFHRWQADFATEVESRPRLCPLAAFLHGRELSPVNRLHREVVLDPVAHALIPHLDGRHDHVALLECLLEHIDAGELSVEVDHQPAGDREQLRNAAQAALEQALAGLARSALLVE